MEPPAMAAGGVPGGGSAPLENAEVRGRFDPKALEPRRPGWLWEFLCAYPQRVIAAFRFCFAVVHFPLTAWYFVLRYDEVREVLSHDRDFPVAWGDKMERLTNGRNFVLGLPRGEAYRERYAQLAETFPLEDVWEHVEKVAAKESRDILTNIAGRSPPRFDAIEELIMEVPARLCKSYYGIQIGNYALFGKWTLAISSYIFGHKNTEAQTASSSRPSAAVISSCRQGVRCASWPSETMLRAHDRRRGLAIPAEEQGIYQ